MPLILSALNEQIMLRRMIALPNLHYFNVANGAVPRVTIDKDTILPPEIVLHCQLPYAVALAEIADALWLVELQQLRRLTGDDLTQPIYLLARSWWQMAATSDQQFWIYYSAVIRAGEGYRYLRAKDCCQFIVRRGGRWC